MEKCTKQRSRVHAHTCKYTISHTVNAHVDSTTRTVETRCNAGQKINDGGATLETITLLIWYN